jgi:hypothetical protein
MYQKFIVTTETVTRPDQIVGCITFDDTLKVYAHDATQAQAFLQAIAVPYMAARDERLSNGAVVWKRVPFNPGTEVHFGALGMARETRQLLSGLFIVADWRVTVPAPTFPALAEYPALADTRN